MVDLPDGLSADGGTDGVEVFSHSYKGSKQAFTDLQNNPLAHADTTGTNLMELVGYNTYLTSSVGEALSTDDGLIGVKFYCEKLTDSVSDQGFVNLVVDDIKYYNTTTFEYETVDSLASSTFGLTIKGYKDDVIFQSLIIGGLPANKNIQFRIRIAGRYGVYMNTVVNVCGFENQMPVWKIKGSPKDDGQGYYVKPTGYNQWEECSPPIVKTTINQYTMPLVCVRASDGRFKLGFFNWGQRLKGDEDSAPDPSFVGGTISDMFFHSNRLWMVSGNNVVGSEIGEYFNFFPTTVLDVLDSDPIDVGASQTYSSSLGRAIPFQDTVLVMGERDQYLLNSGDQPLTPQTTNLQATTRYEVDPNANPVAVGSSTFFACPNGSFMTIREYIVVPDTLTKDAPDVTAHVPQLIPRDPTGNNRCTLITCQAHDLLLVHNGGNTVYAYKSFWAGQDKAQSAWYEWTLPYDVLTMANIDSKVYLLLSFGSSIGMVYLDLDDLNKSATSHLDLCAEIGGTYSDGVTTFDISDYTFPNTENIVVLEPDTLTQLTPASLTDTLITLNGEVGSILVGYLFESKHTLSEWVPKDGRGLSIMEYKIQIRNVRIKWDNDGFFNIEAKTKDQRTAFTPSINIAQTALDSASGIPSNQRFPVLANSRNVLVSLISERHLPFTIQSISLEGLYTGRSKPV
jgi:hypothetical protein